MKISVLRIGHRIFRDQRITTHCALASRAFGADEIIIVGDKDDKLQKNIEKISSEWGGDFKISFSSTWKDIIKKYSSSGYKITHVTMYGLSLQDMEKKLRKEEKILLVAGGEKVPAEVYQLSDYNISVTTQPHSEVSSIAIFLDHIFQGKELKKEFKNAKRKINPTAHGKDFI
ncbi:MAG: tRNA (cytidine(56)-2'-O)-methyltransferase [Candidatus Aenigmarchaeota archaeon]|nr:tRNA (cytidine(56)-2'-O)-methyltransferase [Candidatus Aenigmarchaeota archaeon]